MANFASQFYKCVLVETTNETNIRFTQILHEKILPTIVF